MKIRDMNWMQVEEYLKKDDRAVLPIGSTEQHAQLSLCVDHILSERVAVEAAEPLEVPVFPGVPYGITPYFMAYPGTISLTADTYARLIRDILDSLAAHGFRRIVMVNGHGGNAPVQALIDEWLDSHAGVAVKFHNWWKAPATWKKVMEIDAVASHASWMENFPFTRLDDVQYPEAQKPMLDVSHIRKLSPVEARRYLGDGNFGGRYQRSDQDMLAVWRAGVEETRKVIAEDWS
ncbi:MAG TPA: creatininase family protein [Gammaproteobacteria bacterium]|nr:creatininase family protein [Gammaproteobacteria bacterium]